MIRPIIYAATIFFGVFLYAQDNKVEKGWRFGEEHNATVAVKTAQQDCCAKLQRLIDIAQRQLEVQQKILAILQEQYDPKPKKIKVNGKECIANSSAECFQMPLTPVAKRIPVLKNWVLHPTRENAKEWLRWQAKYFKKVFDAGYAMQFAIAQWGDKAYPIGFTRPTFDSTTGYGSTVLHEKALKGELNALYDKYDLIVFFGKNKDMDIYAFDNVAQLKKDLKNVHFKLVFYNEEVKKLFEDAANLFTNLRYLMENSKMVVDSSLFDKFGVYTTPTVALYIKPTNRVEVVANGRYSSQAYQERIWNMLEYLKIAKSTQLTDYKAWEKYGEYSPQYFKHFYGVDINTTRIEKAYKE